MRVLLIAYYFPPDSTIGAMRPFQFARLLPAHGIDVWVLTVDSRFSESPDADFVAEGVPPERIIRTAVDGLTSERLLKRLVSLKKTFRREAGATEAGGGDDAGGDGGGSSIDSGQQTTAGKLKHLALSWLWYPDRLIGWKRPALEAAESAVARIGFDAVLSTSPPRASHLIAYELTRRLRLPWIMDLRDPWYDEWDTSVPHSKMLQRAYRRLFERCALAADRVVLNTERLRALVVERVPALASSSVAIPNGYDSSAARGCNEAQSEFISDERRERLSVGHYGNVYDQRSAANFLRGLRLWLDRRAAKATGITINFYGSEFGDTAEHVARLGLDSVVKLNAPVPRRRVKDLMRSDYALLLVANGQPVQVPGKAYEYLAACRRIFAITETDSATADMFRQAPGCLLADSPQEVCAALETLWTDYERNADARFDHGALLEETSYTHRTEQIARVIKELLTGKKELLTGKEPV